MGINVDSRKKSSACAPFIYMYIYKKQSTYIVCKQRPCVCYGFAIHLGSFDLFGSLMGSFDSD